MNYIEVVTDSRSFLINLDVIGFIVKERIQFNEELGEFFSSIEIPATFASVRVPVSGKTVKEVEEKQDKLYLAIYNAIAQKQKKIKEIKIDG